MYNEIYENKKYRGWNLIMADLSRLKSIKILAVWALFGLCFMAAASVMAQQGQDLLPKLPDPIQNLANDGAQIRYLGRDHGLDAWLTVKGGQEQYFYVLPDQSAFVMGLLFDKTGNAVTIDQVRKLQKEMAGDDLINKLASDLPAPQDDAQKDASREFLSPSEKLFSDVEDSNWVPIGGANAPAVYAFIDPQCPHCHTFVQNLRTDYIETGKVQLRLIPVGFRPDTLAQAAFLLAAPDPKAIFYDQLDGKENAIPVRADINQQGVQRNLLVMQTWDLDVTPMVIYRDINGTVKIVRGVPADLSGFLADLGIQG